MRTEKRPRKKTSIEQLKETYIKIEKRYNKQKESILADGEKVTINDVKQKPFIYSKVQMEKLAKFGMITCGNCQNIVAGESNHCPKCQTIFRINIQSNFK